MAGDLRNYILVLQPNSSGIRMVTETCYTCNVLWAMQEEQVDKLRTNQRTFYCPNGHGQHYTGKSDADKLKDAQAQLTAKDDQLRAAIRDAEQGRKQILAIRQRIAKGVCPCCNRQFQGLARHMSTQHPTFEAGGDVHALTTQAKFGCSCGRRFDTLQGLGIHQGWQRDENWDAPNTRAWSAHLSVV